MFYLHDSQRYCEGVPLRDLAENFGTPLYVYSKSMIVKNFQAYRAALSTQTHSLCYAVKANSNLAILNLLARYGAGFDIVSVGELQRCIRAGADTQKIVFSGVGKREDEIVAALEADIRCFHVESESELIQLSKVAQLQGKIANFAIRVNPDVDVDTHPYIATGLKSHKFGVAIESAEDLYIRAKQMPGLQARGISCHIGSQIQTNAPFIHALQSLLALRQRLGQCDIPINEISLGGGLGISYGEEPAPDIASFVQNICQQLNDSDLCLLLEPGRSIVGSAGGILMRVLAIKSNGDKHFIIVDAAMNDYIRPALYQAKQRVLAVHETDSARGKICADIVGPVCESGDTLAESVAVAVSEGDLLFMADCGAYGYCMSSNYNSRPKSAEVIVDNESPYLINRRERLEDLMAREQFLP